MVDNRKEAVKKKRKTASANEQSHGEPLICHFTEKKKKAGWAEKDDAKLGTLWRLVFGV